MPETEMSPVPMAKITFRGYLGLLRSNIWKHKGEFFKYGLLLPLVLSIATIWLSVRFGLIPRKDLGAWVMSTAIPVFAIFILSIAIELLAAAYRLHREHEISLQTKQSLLDHAASDRAEEEQRIRDSYERKRKLTVAKHEKEIVELRAQIPSGTEPEPDILLDYDDKGFVLETPQASAHAREITIAPLSTGDYTSGYARFGGQAAPITTSAITAEFAPVGHLYSGDSVIVTPSVRDTGPLNVPSSFDDFINAALKRRQFDDEQQQLTTTQQTAPSADLQPLEVLDQELTAQLALKKHQRRPLDIQIIVSYWNWTKTRQWERSETLRYEPDQKRAYVTHGDRREITANKQRPTVSRELSERCRSLIIQHLKPFVGACQSRGIHLCAAVLWSALSSDASAYAHQLADALRDAGVMVQPQKVGQLSDFEARDCHGLFIRRVSTWGPPEDPPFHETLQTALRACGIDVPIVYATYPPEALVLVVGNAD